MTRKKPPASRPASRRPSARPPTGRPAAARSIPAPPTPVSPLDDTACLRAIVELAEDAVYIKDARLRYAYVNPAAVKYLGASANKLIGRTDAQVFGRALSREVEAIDRKVIKHKQTVTYERRGVSAGRDRVFLTTKAPYRAADGTLLGLIGISREITGRKLAEEGLLRSETKHRQLLNSIQTPVLALDNQLNISYCNQAYAKVIGKPVRDLRGKNLLAVSPRLKSSQTIEAYRRALSTGKPQSVVGKMGDRCLSARVFRTPDGLLALAEDITEKTTVEQELARAREELKATVSRRTDSLSLSNQALHKEVERRERTERTLRDSENKFRTILENSQDIITILNEDGVIKYANAALTAVLGREVGEVLGKKVFDYLHPSDAPRAIKLLSELQQQPGAALAAELRLRHADGGWRLLDVSGKYIPQSQILGGIVINARDITEGRLARDEVRESEERQQLLFDLAPDAYFLCDLKGRLTDCNHAFETLSGMDRRALAGKSLWDLDLLPLEQAPELTALLSRNAIGNEAGLEEFTLRGSDGRAFRAEIKTHPVKIKGQPLMLGVITDVTADRRERDQEKEQYRGLEFLSRAAMELVRLQPGRDLYAFIADRLSELMEGAAAGVIGYDPGKKQYRPLAIAGIEAIRSPVEKLLGLDLMKLAFDEPPDDLKRILLTGKLTKLGGGLHDILFRTVPQSAIREIEKQFRVSECYAMGLVSNDRLLAGVSIILRDGQELAAPAVIEAFVNQVAVALERQLDEDQLRRDIREQERATGALRASDEFSRAIIDHSPLGISVRNAKGELLTCNAAWKRVWGISDEMMIQDIIRQRPELVRLNDESFLAGWRPAVQRVYREGGTLFIPELPIPGNDGAPGRWVAMHFSGLKNGEGAVDRVIIITEDITGRRASEERLKYSEQHFRALIERSAEVITILDQDGTIRYKSPSVKGELGYEPAELVGKPVFDYVHPDDAPALLLSFSHLLQNQGAEGEVEFRFRHRDGRWVILSAAGKNLLGEPAVGGIVINSRNVTGRRQAEGELRESERQYREIFDGVAEGIYRTTPSGRVLVANPALVRMLGYENLDELLLRNIDSEGYFDPSVREKFKRMIEETGEVRDFVNTWRKKDGAPLIVKENAHVVRDETRNLLCYEGTVEDITARTAVESALVESEERYRALVETMNDGLMMTDDNDVILFVNERLCRLLGYQKSELLGQAGCETLIKPEDRGLIREKNRERRTRFSDQYEVRMVRKGGGDVWVRISASATFDIGGAVTGSIGVITDIDASHEAEQALRQSEERYRALTEASPDMIFTVDHGGFVRFINSTAARYLGREPEEVTGRQLRDLFPPEIYEVYWKNLQSVLASGQPLFAQDRAMFQGHWFWLDTWLVPLKDGRGSVDAVMGISRDITARMTAEAALREAEQGYRRLFNSINDSVWVHEMSPERPGKFLEVNDRVCERLGYTREEMLELTVPDIDSPEQQEWIPEISRRLFADGQVEFETDHIAKDGRRVSMELNVRLIKYQGQDAALAVMRDVTERKRVTEALKESEAKLAAIFETDPSGIIIVKRKTRKIIAVNNSALEMIGLLPGDVIGKVCHNFICPAEEGRCPICDLGQTVDRSERVLIKKDGTRIPILKSVVPIVIDGEDCLLESFIDITEHKQAEAALRESEKRYRRFFEQDLTGDYITTIEGQVLDCNPAFARMLGYKSVEAAKQENAESFYPSPDHRRKLLEELRQNRVLMEYEVEMVRRDGARSTVMENIVGVFDDSGALCQIQGYMFDITPRRAAEAALRKSEEQYRTVVNLCQDAIFKVRGTGEIEYASPACQEIFGYSPEEFISQPGLTERILHPDSRQAFAEFWQKYQASGIFPGNAAAWAWIRKDGTTVHTENNFTSITDDRGLITGFLTVARDITVRKRAERALQDSEERFRDIFTYAADGMLLADLEEKRFVLGNQRICDMLGYTCNELLRLSVSDIHPPESVPEITAIFERQSRKEQMLAPDLPVLRKDGVVFYADINSFPVSIGGKKHLLGIFRDVTERKRAEQALRESERRYISLVDNMTDGVYHSTADGRFIDVNPAMVRIFGYGSREELLSVDIPRDLYFADGDRWRDYPKAGKDRTRVLRMKRKDGSEIWVEDSCRYIRNDRGEVVIHEGVLRDITGRMKAEQTLQESEGKYRGLVEATDTGFVIVDQEGRVVDANREYVRLTGHGSLDEIRGRAVTEWTAPEDRERNRDEVAQCAQTGSVRNLEILYTHADGTMVPIEINANTVQTAAGPRIVTLCRDISGRLNAEQTLRDSEERYRTALDSMLDAVHVVDRDLRVLLINTAFIEWMRAYGLPTDAVGKDIFELFPFLPPRVRDEYLRVFETGSPVLAEETSVLNGCAVITSTRKIPIEINGKVERVLTVIRDITERKATEERILFLTFHDRLTGLYNRAGFEERAKELDTPEHVPLSLIMGDANGLKLVNDAFGHDAGDKFLQGLAGIIKACVRPDDLVFRWGGDEFVVLMPGADNEAAQAVCEAVHRACLEAPEDPIRPSIALGPGTKTDPGQTINQVMMEAEDRMYRHKLVESKSLRSAIISSLGRTLWEADYETEEHALRLQALAKEFGRSLKLTDSEMNDLMMLAALHDIGKIAIADGILLKPSMLSESEWEIVRKHPEIGFRIAQASPELAPIAEGILHHHERWDGGGYPQGLQAERIPVIARILAIIDAYDVMTEKRLYKTTVSKTEAIAELERCAGSQFDPKLVGLFVKIISRK